MGNQITIKGRLARDPSLKEFTKDGKTTSVCNITIASDRSFGDGTDFWNCFQFGKGGEALEKYFSKGKEILVYGEMQIDVYKDKDGNNRYPAKCKISHWEFCGSKSDNDNSSKSEPSEEEPTVDGTLEENSTTLSEDIPF